MQIRLISADLFCSDGHPDWKHPIAIHIAFSNGMTIRLRGASDGESVTVDGEPLDGVTDMAEWGKIETHVLTERFDNPVLASEISTVNKILDCENTVVGMALVSNARPILCVWNYGDELHYGDAAAMTAQDWDLPIFVSELEFELR